MKKLMIALAFAGIGTVAANAQTEIETPGFDKYSVATNDFWCNWYLQVGVDMTLIHPYGTKKWMDNVFPNGKSFGVDLAVGKWFTPGLGVRAKLLWGNGIIENKHYTWGAEYDKGGFGAIYGDLQFNLSNLLYGYSDTRVWNFIPYARAGVLRNFGEGEYTPALGLGVENTWRLSQRMKLFLDVAYTATTGAFVPYARAYKSDHGTSTGLTSIDLGLQFNLGKSTFDRAISADAYNALAASSEEALARLRADLDRERQLNADLRAQLAKWANHKCPETPDKVVASAAASVFFELNSSKIDSQKDLINLESLATTAKNLGAKVLVTGSADSKTGNSAYNQKLSEARAQAVADELVNLGVSRDKIEVKAVGGVNEVTPYVLNRRAIIELK